MKIKRLILGWLLNRRQREVIWQALCYSAHTYVRRGQAKEAATVIRVIDETGSLLDVGKKTWTKEEVENLIEESSELVSKKVNEIANEKYKQGFQAGRSEAIKERIFEDMASGTPIVVKGKTFSKEECESCEEKEGCSLYAVLKEEFDKGEEEEAKPEKSSEQAEEAPEKAE